MRRSPRITLAGCLIVTALAATTGLRAGTDGGSTIMAAKTNATRGTLSAQPTGEPNEVRFTGHGDGASWFGGVRLETGDGTILPVCRSREACRDFETVHAYAAPGTYQAALKAAGEGDSAVLARITVTIGN